MPRDPMSWGPVLPGGRIQAGTQSRPEIFVFLLEDVGHYRAAAAHVAQDRFQGRPQVRALGLGQHPRILCQLPASTAGGLGRLGPDRLPDGGEQLLLVMEEPAAM